MFRGFWGDSLILFTIIWGNSQPAVNGRDEICPEESREWSRRVTDKIWYMAKGHPKVGWAPIGFAVAAHWTNLPQGIVLGIVLGWAPIGFAVKATPRLSQYYFGHT